MRPADRSSPLRVGLISLGCAKNLVDAEIMLGALLRAGFQTTNDPDGADVLIINTCSFIDAAQQESVDTILEAAADRVARRPDQAIVVAGCLPQRFGQSLPALLPEVEAFMGLDQVPRVAEIVQAALQLRRARIGAERTTGRGTSRRASAARQPPQGSESAAPAADTAPALLDVSARPRYLPDAATARLRLAPPHMAYVKIAEGCNHPCSFCTIPRIRGRYRSRPLADIVQEVERLVADGVKEVNLISQDSTWYGRDLCPGPGGGKRGAGPRAQSDRAQSGDGPSLSALLRQLDALPGDFWIRVLYTHPAHWTEELIETMAGCRKVVRYADIPLQHIHDNMLDRMRRGTSREYLERLLDRIRSGIPGITLRTTFIVGFPGETEACFRSLLDFVRQTRFERVGVFAYSRENGTRAAAMAGQVPAREKRRRRDLLLAAQQEVSRAIAASLVGQTLRVLVERRARPAEVRSIRACLSGLARQPARPGRGSPLGSAETWFVARSQADAPDVDGRVFVRGMLPVGQFASIRVLGHTDYDLLAEPAG